MVENVYYVSDNFERCFYGSSVSCTPYYEVVKMDVIFVAVGIVVVGVILNFSIAYALVKIGEYFMRWKRK